jgi:hypothetical protein
MRLLMIFVKRRCELPDNRIPGHANIMSMSVSSSTSFGVAEVIMSLAGFESTFLN